MLHSMTGRSTETGDIGKTERHDKGNKMIENTLFSSSLVGINIVVLDTNGVTIEPQMELK